MWSDGKGAMWCGGERDCYIEGMKVVELHGEWGQWLGSWWSEKLLMASISKEKGVVGFAKI